MNGGKDKKTTKLARVIWESEEFFSKPSSNKFNFMEITVNNLIKNRESLNKWDEDGLPLLFQVNSSESKPLFKVINSRNQLLSFPPIEKNRRFKLSRSMIENGANPNTETYNGNNLLSHMCINDVIYDEPLQYLIELGVDINHQNMNDLTILHEICHNTSSTNTFFETVLLLIKNGANPLIKDMHDHYPKIGRAHV